MRARYTKFAFLLACVCASVTCTADRELAPLNASGASNGLLGSLSGLLIAPVNRTTPLASDVTWTFTATSAGAVSSDSAVGLTITIPAGALDSTQQITVTALAGSSVAYSFAPHLVFAAPVTLTQSLQGTTASPLSLLRGAHFAADSLTLTNGLALVDEIVPALTSWLDQTVSFSVGHFSGWIVASCDDSGDGNSSSMRSAGHGRRAQ